jgi:hypothetical protein
MHRTLIVHLRDLDGRLGVQLAYNDQIAGPYPLFWTDSAPVWEHKKEDALVEGTKLFEGVFSTNQAKTAFEEVFADIQKPDYGVILVIIPDACKAAWSFPWEFMCPQRGDFLLDQRILVLVSNARAEDSYTELHAAPKFLIAYRNAIGWRPIKWLEHVDAIKSEISSSQIAVVQHQNGLTPPKISSPDLTILHLLCHGKTRKSAKGHSEVVLVDAKYGFPRYLTPIKFNDILKSSCSKSLPLIFINACSSAHRDAGSLMAFRNFPDLLLTNGLAQTVIAHSRPITEKVAKEFACKLYGSIARGHSLTRALLEARQAAKAMRWDITDWACPRVHVGQNFGFVVKSSPRKEPPQMTKRVERPPKISANRRDFYALQTEVTKTRALNDVLTTDSRVRESFKAVISADVAQTLEAASAVIGDRNSPPRKVERVRRACLIQQKRVLRLLAFRLSPADVVARGIVAGAFAAIVGAVILWTTLYTLASPQFGFNFEYSHALAVPRARETALRQMLLSHAAFSIREWHFHDLGTFIRVQFDDPDVRGKLNRIILIAAVIGGVLGVVRSFVGAVIGFKWPLLHIMVGVGAGSFVGQIIYAALAWLEKSSHAADGMILDITKISATLAVLLGGVAWIVSGLQVPTRLRRFGRTISGAVVVSIATLGIQFLCNFGFSSVLSPSQYLSLLQPLILVFVVTAALGYALSRS